LSTPGAPPLRSSRRGRAAATRVGTLCASAGRWGSPADAHCAARRVRPPFGPSACLASPAPPPQPPQHAHPDPLQGRGLCPPPRRPPCVPPRGVRRPLLGMRRSAPQRVVGVRRPMPLVAHVCLPLRHPLAMCTPTAAFAGAPGVRSSSIVPPSGALSLSALAPYPAPPLVRC
jgi:hypothetical protein